MSIRDHSEIHGCTHSEPIGCLNDFCGYKKDVIFKLRTGDVCMDCIERLMVMHTSTLKVEQILRLLEGMRDEMKYSMHFHRNFKPSHLKVEVGQNHLILLDYDETCVRLKPIEMTMYLLFLKHPNGIRYNHLVDHRAVLKKLHIQTKRTTEASYDSEHYKSVENVIKPIGGGISTIVAKIKDKYIEAIGPNFSAPYIIEGPDGEEKRIALSREYVIDFSSL